MARRPLRALQVEVTSRCSRSCVVCPRTGLGERWLEGALCDAHWRRLRSDLPLVEHLHLQGWGEPLLDPRLESMTREGVRAGCTVGVTSNGDLLADAIAWMVDAPVDVVAVSFAGCGERNRRLRDGARSQDLLAVLAELAHARGRRRRPRIHVAYLLTRDSAGDLPEVVRSAARSGADMVLVSHLDCLPTEDLRDRAAFVKGTVPDDVRAVFAEAERVAGDHRVSLRLPAVEPREMLTCALDPRVMASVRWDGVVAPCVHLNLPIEGSIPRWAADGPVEVTPFAYGHLDEASLAEILTGDRRREFIAPLHRRCEADARYREWGLLPSGWGVVALADLDRAYRALERALEDSPLPAACRACAKAVGW